MLKVAIVGCGKIADAHAAQIQRIPGCEIVAVCDREALMGQQLCERFAVPRSYTDVAQLLEDARPEVVHITTPPQSHFELAKTCMQQGCHVYVEKPFTLRHAEAEELIAQADRCGVKLTVGHDAQFSPAARRLRRLIQAGYLGGAPVHMESTWCYEFGDKAYAQALLGDANHWVRGLPGKLLHNIISHGTAKIAEFLGPGVPQVWTCGFVSPFLRARGEREIVDELRVIVRDEQHATAYFTFSSQMRPSLHQFCIYGPKNGLVLNEDQQMVLTLKGKRYKSYLERFVPPFRLAGECMKNEWQNARAFFKKEFQMEAGKRHLIEAFYRSIREGLPVPLPYREILLTSRLMDMIFDQIWGGAVRKT